MPIVSGGGGGGAFNGGTITEGLTIADPDGAEDQLTITGTGSGAAKLINATAVHTTVTVDSDGAATLASDDQMNLNVSGTAGTDGVIRALRDTPAASVALDTTNGVIGSWADVNTAFRLNNKGFVIILHSAPADGDLAAGEMALWFDQTNGAAKLMVKAKQADGTVKTAAIALS